MSDYFLIILLSHDEISTFLLSVIVWNSSLLTGVLICLSRKSLLLGSRQIAGPGPGCLFFPFFCFNFCGYSPALLFSNDQHLSLILY